MIRYEALYNATEPRECPVCHANALQSCQKPESPRCPRDKHRD